MQEVVVAAMGISPQWKIKEVMMIDKILRILWVRFEEYEQRLPNDKNVNLQYKLNFTLTLCLSWPPAAYV